MGPCTDRKRQSRVVVHGEPRGTVKALFDPGDFVIISNWAPDLVSEKVGIMLDQCTPATMGHKYLVLTADGPEWFEEYRIFGAEDDM